MIYCLTGKLLEKAPDYAVVSCGGVGYLAAIPSTTAGALPAVGDTCTLYTCMNVTENDVSLFGFADKESQTMFRLLTGVSGVGPKVGLPSSAYSARTELFWLSPRETTRRLLAQRRGPSWASASYWS